MSKTMINRITLWTVKKILSNEIVLKEVMYIVDSQIDSRELVSEGDVKELLKDSDFQTERDVEETVNKAVEEALEEIEVDVENVKGLEEMISKMTESIVEENLDAVIDAQLSSLTIVRRRA